MTQPSRRVVLVITDNRFWRGTLGSQVRIRTLLQHLQQRGDRVLVAFNGRPFEDDRALARQLSGIEVCFRLPALMPAPTAEARAAGGLARVRQRLGYWRRWLRAACSPWRVSPQERSQTPWKTRVRLRAQEARVSDGVDAALPAFVQRVMGDGAPAVVLVEYLRLAWLVAPLRRTWPHARWLIDTHDVMHERQARFHATGETHDLDASASEERDLLSQFDAVLAIQDRDAETFRRMGVTAQVLTVVHPVQACRVDLLAGLPPGIGFLGSDMPPNRQALDELVFHIWPRVLAGSGSSAPRLVVAGAVCEALRGRPLPSGVELLGQVQHTDDFYAGVSMVVCPVRFGGGLKIKVVEALCRGKPVITTSVGAEGLTAHSDDGLIVQDGLDELVAAVLHWLSDARLLRRAQEAALRYGELKFSPQAAFASLWPALDRSSSSAPAVESSRTEMDRAAREI